MYPVTTLRYMSDGSHDLRMQTLYYNKTEACFNNSWKIFKISSENHDF